MKEQTIDKNAAIELDPSKDVKAFLDRKAKAYALEHSLSPEDSREHILSEAKRHFVTLRSGEAF